ncbi:MAG TPA: hypothetical protein VKB51_16780 [bacterium]|nr:hypothetical protein [bacterium]
MRRSTRTPRLVSARPARLPALLLSLLLALAAGGCSVKYSQGQALEQQGRWEEAMQAYHEALIDSPDNPDYRAAFQRSEKVVARDNFERYKTFLAEKSFRKAYARLVAAARQDPSYAPVQQEMAKWERVLVSGQVTFKFDTAQTDITLAQQIQLVVRINTPNPGETIDADVDIDNGTFFAEDLLYNRPNELLTLYSINSIGVELTYGRTRIKQFTSTDFQRFINVRTPILDNLTGTMDLRDGGTPRPVASQRVALPRVPISGQAERPPPNPHYSLQIQGSRILVSTPPGAPSPDFTPRFLYVNKADRRVYVDFGRYQVQLGGRRQRWSLRRLPLVGQDYFQRLARNIALQPYFFYREGVFTYVPAGPG